MASNLNENKYCAVHSSSEETIAVPSLRHSCSHCEVKQNSMRKIAMRKLFRFLLRPAMREMQTVDCRAHFWCFDRPCHVKNVNINRLTIRKRDGEKLFAIHFPLNGFSRSYRARRTETQCHLHCVLCCACVRCSRSVVNSFFIGYLTDI